MTKMNFNQRVYLVAKKIPRGKVASYGQIAALAGSPRAARVVGWALHVMPEEDYKIVPWQRVINSRGMISTTCREHSASLQADLLRHEGIEVTRREDGSMWIDLEKHLWHPVIEKHKTLSTKS